MASGALNTSGSADSYKSYFRLTWSSTVDKANNRSLVTWKLYVIANTNYYSNAVKINSVYLNGTKIASAQTWSSVSKGTTLLKSGTIYVSHNSNGAKSFSMSISGWFYPSYTVSGSGTGVLDTIPLYKITTSAGTGGTITKSITSATYNATYTIASTPSTNYIRDYMVVDGVNKGNVSSVKVAIGSKNHTVQAYFKKKTYRVTTSIGTVGGTISPTIDVAYDSYTTINITPDRLYAIDYVVYDGVNLGAVDNVVVDMDSKNHTVVAYFKKAINARVGSINVEEIKVGDKPVISMMIDNEIIF